MLDAPVRHMTPVVCRSRISSDNRGLPRRFESYAIFHIRTIEVLRRSREWGYEGGRSALFELVRKLRPAKTTEPMVRFEGLPGEFAQFDFGEGRVRFADHRRRKVTFFVGRLKYSRLLHVVLCPDQKAETLIRAVIECLVAFGGAPKEWVFDNPKTVRVSPPGAPIAFHPYLRDLAAELNVLPTLCTPRAANQKGSVENGVGFVKKNFLFARSFRDQADVLAQLGQWLEEVNTKRPCAATGQIPQALLAEELPWLSRRPVLFTAAEYPVRDSAVITPMATVRFNGTSYTAPPRRIGATATLLVRKETIEVVVDEDRSVHARDDYSDRVVRLPAHNQETLKVIHGQRKKNYFRRQCLLELGPGAFSFLEQVVHRYPGGTWHPLINSLYELAQGHPRPAMDMALALCHAAGRYDYNAVVRMLQEVA